jgi:hypothetical protein
MTVAAAISPSKPSTRPGNTPPGDNTSTPQQQRDPLKHVSIEQGDGMEHHSFWSPSATELNSTNVDARFVLPKCELPPRDKFEPVETFVSTAVREQHELNMTNDSSTVVPILKKNYLAILEALRFKSDVPLLTTILLAMRTSRNTVHLLTASNKHARLIHQIVRFNPFELPVNRERRDSTEAIGVAIDFGLVDAHLSLIVALVSANSVFLVPATTALWKLLIANNNNLRNNTSFTFMDRYVFFPLIVKGVNYGPFSPHNDPY